MDRCDNERRRSEKDQDMKTSWSKTKHAILAASIIAQPHAVFAESIDQYSDALPRVKEILNLSLGNDTSGIPADSPIATYISFMQGKPVSSVPTQQQVCDAWKRVPSDQPFDGIFLAGDMQFSLDKMCKIKR
jgi:hypothetical protein